MMRRKKHLMGRLTILLMIIGITIVLATLLYPIRIDDRKVYFYSGVDCYISYNVTQSLSNVSEIINEQGFSLEVWYKRSSPDGSGEVLDFVRFSYNYSTPKNVSGYVYNFDTDNLTIKLHYYPDDHSDVCISYRTEEKARNETYSLFHYDKCKMEPDVDYIISIFNLELNSNPRSVNYVQLIEHQILL